MPSTSTTPSATDDRPLATQAKIFVGGLPLSATSADVHAHFSRFGEVASATVMLDRVTGESRGFGFVLFASMEDADRTLKAERHQILGKPVTTRLALPRGDQQLDQFRPRKVFVGSLSIDIPEGAFRDLIEKEGGRIEDIRFEPQRGFAIVDFASADDAQRLVDTRHFLLGGVMLRAKFANRNAKRLVDTRLLVSGIPDFYDIYQVYNLFGFFGKVLDARLLHDPLRDCCEACHAGAALIHFADDDLALNLHRQGTIALGDEEVGLTVKLIEEEVEEEMKKAREERERKRERKEKKAKEEEARRGRMTWRRKTSQSASGSSTDFFSSSSSDSSSSRPSSRSSNDCSSYSSSTSRPSSGSSTCSDSEEEDFFFKLASEFGVVVNRNVPSSSSSSSSSSPSGALNYFKTSKKIHSENLTAAFHAGLLPSIAPHGYCLSQPKFIHSPMGGTLVPTRARYIQPADNYFLTPPTKPRPSAPAAPAAGGFPDSMLDALEQARRERREFIKGLEKEMEELMQRRSEADCAAEAAFGNTDA